MSYKDFSSLLVFPISSYFPFLDLFLSCLWETLWKPSSQHIGKLYWQSVSQTHDLQDMPYFPQGLATWFPFFSLAQLCGHCCLYSSTKILPCVNIKQRQHCHFNYISWDVKCSFSMSGLRSVEDFFTWIIQDSRQSGFPPPLTPIPDTTGRRCHDSESWAT